MTKRLIPATLITLAIAAIWLVSSNRGIGHISNWGSIKDIFSQEASQRYVEGIAGSPNYVNPLLCQYNQVDRDIAALVFSGLTATDANDTIIPDLAQTWAVSGDSLVYTFTLRADARWHDGTPVSAHDVVYTINSIQSPDYRGAPYLADQWCGVTITEIDTYTVQFRLAEPRAPFLSYTTIGILPAHLLEAVPAAALPEHRFNRAPIGTGTFVVRELDAAHVVLIPFKDYYLHPPQLPEVELRFYPNHESVWAAYRRGEINGIGDAAASAEMQLSQTEMQALNFYSAPRAGYGIVFLNLQHSLFAEKEVRQALLYALDRQLIVDLVLDRRGMVAHSPVMPNSWAYNAALKKYDYEPDSAAALLDWSGWRDRDGDGVRENGAGEPFTFVLLTDDTPAHLRLAEEVAQQWARVGIKARVKSVPMAEIVHDYLRPRRFDALLLPQHRTQIDPDPYTQWHSAQTTSEGQNYAGLHDVRIDGLIDKARRVPDYGERAALYREFQDIFAEEVPALLLYYPLYNYAVDKRVQNVELSTIYDASDRFKSIKAWIME